jgi:hypothetical protein
MGHTSVQEQSERCIQRVARLLSARCELEKVVDIPIGASRQASVSLATRILRGLLFRSYALYDLRTAPARLPCMALNELLICSSTLETNSGRLTSKSENEHFLALARSLGPTSLRERRYCVLKFLSRIRG